MATSSTSSTLPISTDPTKPHELTLYATSNSDCSTRLRLALALKRLPYTYVDAGSPFGAGRPASYEKLNPSNSLPTLVVRDSAGKVYAISQSMAALEFLEDVYPTPHPLMPASPLARARVRALAAIIASDTHPFTAPRVGRRIRAQFVGSGAVEGGGSVEGSAIAEWDQHFVARGLEVYEKTLGSARQNTAAAETAEGADASAHMQGRYSVGDSVSLADVCLLPQVWRARARNMDLSPYPSIQRIVGNLETVDGVLAAHWDNQGR